MDGMANIPAMGSLKEKVSILQDEVLKMPQAACPVRHIFMPGIYMREVTIPAGVVAVGHYQKFEHVNILVKGRVTVLGDNGPVELTAPLTFIGQPGKKCGYIHEETIWINVHHVNCTDVETAEALLYDLDAAPERRKGMPDQARMLALADYGQLLKDIGMDEDAVQAELQREDDLVPMPHGIFKVKIGESAIHGKGLIATADIAEGEFIAPGNIQGKRTPAGRYCNHSGEPNARAVTLPNGDVHFVALRSISGCTGGNDGEEILTDYRQNLLTMGREICPR